MCPKFDELAFESLFIIEFTKEKGRDLTQSYDKHPKKQHDNTQTPPKTSITKRLQTNLGRSVGVTTATQLVKAVYRIPTFPLTTRAVSSKGHTFPNL